MPTEPRIEEHLIELLEIASKAQDRAQLTILLQSVAQRLGANGAIIWREKPDSRKASSEGSLFVFADWFEPPHRCFLHNLPMGRSATGSAILGGYQDIIVDTKDPLVFNLDGFLELAEIQTFSISPIRFAEHHGALNLYFKKKSALSGEDLTTIGIVAKSLPHLIQTVRTNAAHALTLRISELLGKASNTALLQERKQVFSEVCSAIAGRLHALEVSLFLRDPTSDRSTFELIATTWPPHLKFSKVSYAADKSEGLTAWPLVEQKAVNIFDLKSFRNQETELANTYPGITWKDSLSIDRNAPKLFRKLGQEGTIPYTFLAVPILQGADTLGVIRCCAATKAPYFYGEIESEILYLVASQIATSWAEWISRKNLETENAALQRFVDRIGELNNFVGMEAQSELPDEVEISRRVLALAGETLATEITADIRSLDKETGTLSFQVFFGADWDLGTPESQAARKARTFATSDYPPTSAGAWVVQENKTLLMPGTGGPYSPTFHDDRWLVASPIVTQGNVSGVLDLRGKAAQSFPARAVPIASLLAKQLGLYRDLIATIVKLRQQPQEFAQSFEDFHHQLKTPILKVYARAKRAHSALTQLGISEDIRREYQAVRGLAGKCRKVSESLRLFALLAQQKEIPINVSWITPTGLLQLLTEFAADAQDLIDPSRKLSFKVERISLRQEFFDRLRIDEELLLQALMNLVDNAEKYSFQGTTVLISAGISKTGWFRLAVSNTGISISGVDLQKCKTRKWRGEEAEAVTGEGSGIGLWITDKIMEAHSGRLNIQATNASGLTIVELLFPTF